MSLDFSVNGIVSAGDASISGTRTFSVFAWVRPDTVTSAAPAIFVQGGSTGRWEFGLYNPGTGPRLYFNFTTTGVTGSWFSPTNSVTVSAWQSVAMTMNGSTLAPTIFYVNGVLVATTINQSPTGVTSADPQAAYIGRQNDGGRAFDGRIGEVAMWRQIHTAAEMAAIHAAGINMIPTNREVYLPLDSGRVQDFGTGELVAARTWTAAGGAVAAENPPTRAAGRSG